MAAARVDNELSEWKSIQRGVRQGCVLLPDLFSMYNKMILRDIEGIGGITVGGRNIKNVRFADDTVFVAETEKELQEILHVGVTSSEAKGLTFNCKKTVSMVFIRESGIPNSMLQVHNEVIKQEEHFTYLGGELTSDEKSNKEVKKKIGMAKATFSKLKTVLINHPISKATKLTILKCYVWSVCCMDVRHGHSTKTWKIVLKAVKCGFSKKITESVMERSRNK